MNGYLAAVISIIIIITAFLVCFELKKPSAARLMPIVMLVVIGSVGRIIFAFIPQVQPVTAIVIIAGACLGPADGFMTGVLCAAVSNIALGHGPWTPFQMLAWGVTGVLAGVIAKTKVGSSLAAMTVYSVFAGAIFSVITDLYTVASLFETMTVSYALTIILTGLVFNISHMIFNAVFILILYLPFRHMLKRVRKKYL